ncbi:LanM family lanthionine synthetase [Kribbella sp. ALI-6-A]|uniref:type 2 lanthipeptide synthetase LanM family protein n=1 Tax=Kribbella sp. ALI-6-A TaxID=1933817 RepID=UPI00097C08AD|nr:type 2 lanthipeptide synthetase LanM family protein [Kribbella sp. ALI-6-A]ONI69010.1 LanM family lanthionine synthetase [Kribbella sp. ALI-6-A]
MLDSATAAAPPTDQPKAWWSAGLAPHEPASPMPGWAAYVERSLDGSTAAQSVQEPANGDWQQTVVRCLRPLLQTAREDLTAAGHTGPVTEQFLHRLGLRLVKLSARTLVLELNTARQRGDLAGATPAERFTDFTHRLVGGSELAGFLAAYPVLARVLGEACRQSVEGHLELLARLAEDRELLVADLLGGQDPGPLTGVEPGGDLHHGGRCTAILTFAGNRRIVYKPRPLDLHVHFNDLVQWMNDRTGLAIRVVRVVARSGYGWLEHIDHHPCTDLAGVSRFYQRQGALLALLYVLDGTDMHYENLIAAGDQPVLVDVETLFHPNSTVQTATGIDPAHAALRDSVYRTALLPLLLTGEHGVADLSGLGGDADALAPHSVVDWADAGLDTMRLVRRRARTRGGRNRPYLDGGAAEPRDHELGIAIGFRLAYTTIVRHRDELLGPGGPIERCADDEVRYVARPTRVYTSLLDEATHPNALRTADNREAWLELLWETDPTTRRLVPHELGDLRAGDVPLFVTRPGGTDVWAADGTRIPGMLSESGLDRVRAKIAALNEVDQHRQLWIISASLATRPGPVVHTARPSRPGLGTTEADPEQLLASATDIADEIVAQAVGDRGGHVNWLGLELLDDHHWAVLPMGAGLTSGYLGTAMFLAQVGQLTGASKYGELAWDAIQPVPSLLESLRTDPAAVQAIGVGMHGLGGIAYGLHRLAGLLDDPAPAAWLADVLELCGQVEPDSGFPTFVDGAAGGLAAMQAIEGVHTAASLAVQYADQLASLVEQSASRGADSADGLGFARGHLGIAWALGRYRSADPRHREAALVAARLGSDTPSPGWCSGHAGTILARWSAGQPIDVDEYLTITRHRPLLDDLSLCHGELGALEPLLWLVDQYPAAEVVRRRRAGMVLTALAHHGPRCGTPGSVASSGLLNGLAGIGYGLLRLGFHRQVPSFLFPPPVV